MHRYHVCHGSDADYIVFESRVPAYTSEGWGTRWLEHTRWMIPGTQIED
jgi:hypothetical protein